MGERGAAKSRALHRKQARVEGLTKAAALEAAPFGVRVNAVAPGPTETAMLDRLTGTPDKKAAFYASVPLKRGARPEEIADAIAFLASDKASFVTGQIIRVNGGQDGELSSRSSKSLSSSDIRRSTMASHTHQPRQPNMSKLTASALPIAALAKPAACRSSSTSTSRHDGPWDPAVTDGLAKDREVVLFNNAGVSSSSGEVPTSSRRREPTPSLSSKRWGLDRSMSWASRSAGSSRRR